MRKLSWQAVVLYLGGAAMIIGACIWGIEKGKLAAEVIFVPIGTIIVAAVGRVVSKLSYDKGRSEIPPALTNPRLSDHEILAAVKTLAKQRTPSMIDADEYPSEFRNRGQ